jgi:hypothetical protein
MIPYEYVDGDLDEDGRAVPGKRRIDLLLADWDLDDRDRRALVAMLLVLFRADADQAIGSIIFKRPKAPGVYYAKATGNVQLRPRLCRGPERPNDEVTFLVRAIERGGVTLPFDADKRALKLIPGVSENPHRRKRYNPMPPKEQT